MQNIGKLKFGRKIRLQDEFIYEAGDGRCC